MAWNIGHGIVVLALACVGIAFPHDAYAAEPVSFFDLPYRPHFIRFGPEQGLSTAINDLAVDRQGYVWLATGDGLARYDGTGFKHWRRVIGDPKTLPDNEVTLIHVDVHDRLWAATWFALSVLEPGGRIPRTIEFKGDASRCGIEITAMTSAPDGTLWIGNHAGELCRISQNGEIAKLYQDEEKSALFETATPLAIHVQPSGKLLVGTNTGLWQVDPKASSSRSIAPYLESIGKDLIFALSSQPDGTVWIGAENGLFRLDPLPDAVPTLSDMLPQQLARRAVVHHARDGNHWIGSYYGLYRRRATQAKNPGLDEDLGVDSGVIKIVEDLDGGLWFASYSQGILYLPRTNEKFTIVPDFFEYSYSKLIGADFDGGGNLWILANNGVYQIKNGSKKFSRILSSSQLGINELRSIRSCQNGVILIVDSGGITKFNLFSNKIKRINLENNELHSPETVACDEHGRMWVSFFGGAIAVYSKENKLIEYIDAVNTLGEKAEAFIDIRFSPDGEAWYSDGHNLRRWNGKRFARVFLLPGEYVFGLDFVAPDQLWVARFGSLERYRINSNVLEIVEKISDDSSILAAESRSILATKGGMVWRNTVRGLIQYDINHKRARLFGWRDGLQSIDSTIEVLNKKFGLPTLAISKKTILLFDPDSPLPTPQMSVLSIEAAELRRGRRVISYIDQKNEISEVVMLPGDRDLRVAVRVMSFVDPAAHRYRSRLQGYDPDWIMQGDRGERMFSTLPPGRYRLDVQGANADGIWSDTRRIDVLVVAPWWRRWWAFASYALLAILLVLWSAHLYRLRLKRRHDYQLAEQRRQLAEQASQAKSRFLANLGHEVRTPMTGVLGMSELLLSTALDIKQAGQVQAIRRAGEHLLRLVNDALDLARIEAGRLELESVDFDIDALVQDVIALMRPLAERKALVLRIEIEDEVRGSWRGDPTRIRQILLNLLANAVKFTEHGMVTLSIFQLSPLGLCCVVNDTGPGLDDEQQQRLFRRFEQAEGARTASRYGGSGLGLAICQELAMAMGGDIALRSVPGEGASFTVRLPLQRGDTAAIPLSGESVGMHEAYDVLLVEDDAIVADVLVGMLQAQGHRVAHAAHALAAMNEVATYRFDIALVDLDLPGMDGLTLAQHLREQCATMAMAAITASADGDAEQDAKAAGFDAFLRKPLTGEGLANALRGLLAQRSIEC